MPCIYKEIINNDENKCTLNNKCCDEDDCKDKKTEIQLNLKDWHNDLVRELNKTQAEKDIEELW